jgi:hypothetical protein
LSTGQKHVLILSKTSPPSLSLFLCPRLLNSIHQMQLPKDVGHIERYLIATMKSHNVSFVYFVDSLFVYINGQWKQLETLKKNSGEILFNTKQRQAKAKEDIEWDKEIIDNKFDRKEVYYEDE